LLAHGLIGDFLGLLEGTQFRPLAEVGGLVAALCLQLEDVLRDSSRAIFAFFLVRDGLDGELYLRGQHLNFVDLEAISEF